jgi:choice-of-anchor A domain-containing protein
LKKFLNLLRRLSASAVFGGTNNRVQILNQTAGINLVVINLSGSSVSLLASMDNSVGWLSSTSGLAGTIWNFYQAVSLDSVICANAF